MFMHTMNFDLGEDVNAMREMVHRWAQDRVRPLAAGIDASNEFPSDLWTDDFVEDRDLFRAVQTADVKTSPVGGADLRWRDSITAAATCTCF